MKRSRVKTSPKTRARRSSIALLDDHARQVVFERDDFRCVAPMKDGSVCGKRYGIEWSHILSREDKSTRWMPENAVTFCRGHHAFWWHKHPVLAMIWFQETYPDRLEKILAMRNSCKKVTDADLREMAEALHA